jgi:ketosteroid isomerase-like protein
VERLIQALQDRADITDLLARLAQAQDDKDWAAVGAAYLPDAVYVHPAGRLEGVAEIVERTRNALGGLDASQHLVGSIVVAVTGDTATSRAHFQAQHLRSGAPGGDLYTIAGTYADDWDRTPDGWRISVRTQTYSWRSGNRAVIG